MTERNNSLPNSNLNKREIEILDEIKGVWALMEEEKEYISNCAVTLKEHEHTNQQLENHLIDLKTSVTKNISQLETSNDFQENIKFCNKMFLISMQQIYTDFQQYNTNCNVYENEQEQLLKIFGENERKCLLVKNKFEQEEKKLLTNLDIINEEQMNINDKMIANEGKNRELQNVLDLLEKIIAEKENDAKILADSGNDIAKHQKLLKKTDDDLNAAAKTMDTFLVQQQVSQQPYLRNIQQFEQRYQDIQIALEKQRKKMIELRGIKKKMQELTLINVPLLETYEISHNDIRDQVTASSRDCMKKLEEIVNQIDEYETLYFSHNDVIRIIDQDSDSMREKNEALQKEINELHLHIKEMQDVPEVDINLLDEKKLQLREIKISRKLMKDGYTTLSLSLQIESTKLQVEITECQLTLNQLQQDYEHMEAELSQLISNRDSLLSEKRTHEIELEDLKEKVKSMNVTLNNLKAEMQQTFNKPYGVTKLKPKVKVPKYQWESDSSIEGVDHTISMRNKLKLQRRKQSEN